MTQFLIDGQQTGSPVFLFAHGAGVGMDSEFMTAIARGFADKDIGVARFEFNYMAARRSGGGKRPPTQMHKLEAEFHDAIASLNFKGPLFIGENQWAGASPA